jgi:hypothetical protein
MNKKDIDDKSWEIMIKFTNEFLLLCAILGVLFLIGLCLI